MLRGAQTLVGDHEYTEQEQSRTSSPNLWKTVCSGALLLRFVYFFTSRFDRSVDSYDLSCNSEAHVSVKFTARL